MSLIEVTSASGVLRAVAWWAEHDKTGGRRDAFAAFTAGGEDGVGRVIDRCMHEMNRVCRSV